MQVTLAGIEYKIHFRYTDNYVDTSGRRVIRGRVTHCFITVDNLVRSEGTAICSERDNFVKEQGRKVSLGRALKKLNEEGIALSKEHRAGFWNAYLKRPRGKSDERTMGG